MFAAHTDHIVLGVGETEALALADADEHGAEDESLLDICEISDWAADYVRAGGDCRRLTLVTLKNGVDRFIIAGDEDVA